MLELAGRRIGQGIPGKGKNKDCSIGKCCVFSRKYKEFDMRYVC